MNLSKLEKDELQRELASCLSTEDEIRRIVVFGSFVHSNDPEDMDVAIFQDSDEGYLSLALKYRKRARSIASRIPLDIVPLRADVDASDSPFLGEIQKGVVIYARG